MTLLLHQCIMVEIRELTWPFLASTWSTLKPTHFGLQMSHQSEISCLDENVAQCCTMLYNVVQCCTMLCICSRTSLQADSCVMLMSPYNNGSSCLSRSPVVVDSPRVADIAWCGSQLSHLESLLRSSIWLVV